MKLRIGILFAALLMFAVEAFPATGAANASTVSPTLKISVTVQKAIQLTMSQGTMCTPSTGGATDYTITFGTVDALGISTPTCGTVYPPTTPGSTPSAVYSDYKLTPAFSGQTSSTGTITAYVSTNFANPTVLAVVQSNTAPVGIGSLTAMSTNSATPTSVGTTVANGAAITRYVGVTVSVQNGGSAFTGADAATVTYTLTAP